MLPYVYRVTKYDPADRDVLLVHPHALGPIWWFGANQGPAVMNDPAFRMTQCQDPDVRVPAVTRELGRDLAEPDAQ